MIIMLVLMVGIFYFMLIRPENKRKKEAERMRSELKTGDRITTIGGITGTVVSVKDDKFVIETGADQVRIEFAEWALSTNDSAAEAAQEAARRRRKPRPRPRQLRKPKRISNLSRQAPGIPGACLIFLLPSVENPYAEKAELPFWKLRQTYSDQSRET